MVKRKKWMREEQKLVNEAAENVFVHGSSYYAQCKRLHAGDLKHRTFEAIRAKIRRRICVAFDF